MEWWSIGVKEHCRNDLRLNTPPLQHSITPFSSLTLLHLPVFQFHRRIPSENVHRHFQLPAIGLHFFDHAAEIEERSVVDFDRLADLKADLRFLMLFRGRNLVLD